METPLFSVPLAPARRGIDFAVSPDRSRIAYTQVDAEGVRLVTANIDGSDARTLLDVPDSDSDIAIGDWSPGSSALLVTEGTRTQCHPQVSTQADSPEICYLDPATTLAIDLNGNILWQHDGNVVHGTYWVGPDKLLLPQDGTSDELSAAQANGFCSTDDSAQTCTHLASGNETLADIASRYGIDPAGIEFFSHESVPVTQIYGLNETLPYNTRLMVPPPRVGRIYDLSGGQTNDLPYDVRGLICVSPDGTKGVTVSTRAEPTPGLPAPTIHIYMSAIDLATGDSIVEFQVASSAFVACNARSWAPDSSSVVLSSWGK